MKVSRLEIENFRHLENLNFDFTYQSGPKKGKPLDKICFIGQSATGKTSLLELIKMYRTNPVDLKNQGSLTFSSDGFKITYKNGISSSIYRKSDLMNIFLKTKLYYFSSDQLSPDNFNNITNNPIKENDITILLATKILNSLVNRFDELISREVLEFNYQTNNLIWEYILNDISSFRDILTQKGSELISKGFHQDFSRLGKEMERWKKTNPNPLENLALKCLNPVLKKLNLEVDLVDTSSLIPLKPIHSDKAIPANALSTGTKQLMLNSLPLYKLNTENAIVIIDEPERSLFPDIQMELIPFYQSLAPTAQFIVATHSPFIAASFEPEERFILYFDEKGKVQVRNGVAPIGDDPNDILKNDFGLDNLMNDSGIKAYKDYLDLKQKMASEKSPEKKKQLLKEVVSLGDKYQF
jgi:hypothetical protein